MCIKASVEAPWILFCFYSSEMGYSCRSGEALSAMSQLRCTIGRKRLFSCEKSSITRRFRFQPVGECVPAEQHTMPFGSNSCWAPKTRLVASHFPHKGGSKVGWLPPPSAHSAGLGLQLGKTLGCCPQRWTDCGGGRRSFAFSAQVQKCMLDISSNTSRPSRRVVSTSRADARANLHRHCTPVLAISCNRNVPEWPRPSPADVFLEQVGIQ